MTLVLTSKSIDEEPRSPAELELDVLLAHELASGSVVADVLWCAVGWDRPSSVNVTMQFQRKVDGRTTDVLAVGDGRSLHCEDKLAKGGFQPEQLASYKQEIDLAPEAAAAVVIAPRYFLESHALPDPIKGVSVERLADALEERIPTLEADTSPWAAEFTRSYRYRAQALREVCAVVGPKLSELHMAFRAAYDERAEDLTDGRVQLKPGTLSQGGGFAWFAAGHPCPPEFELAFKLRDGVLDVRVPGWRLEELKAHVAQLSQERALPSGWRVTNSSNARKNKATGERTHVLRFEVGCPSTPIEQCETLEQVQALGWEAADLTAVEADRIGQWLRSVGIEELRRPSVRTLIAGLATFRATALELGLDDVASTLAELRHRLTDGASGN